MVLKDKYGIFLEHEEFNKLLFKAEFIPEELDKELQKIASRERAKAQETH